MMWWQSLFCFYPLRLFPALAALLAFDPHPSYAQVVINEVYYDHTGKDEGWEFIELYNAGLSACDLSGWSLEALDGATGSKSVAWTAPAGARIESGQFVSIAGASRDPSTGFLLKGVLGNGPDAVRLVSPAGAADLVGYGSCASPDLYETNPAPDVASGSSLARKPDGSDSDRNDIDFAAAQPSPGRRNYFQRDVALEIIRESILPCRGAPFPLSLVLGNRGLEPFNGSLSIETALAFEGVIASCDRRKIDLSLAVSGADSLTITLAAPPGACFEVSVSLLDMPDENAANDTARIRLRSSPGETVINEIMYRPREGRSEWIEIESCAPRAMSLRGWLICDATGSRRLVTSRDLDLPAGGFLILARDSASFRDEHPECGAPVQGIEGGWPSLNDTDRGGYADMLELFDSDTVLVDRISYRNLLGEERGRSLERVSETMCSSLPGGLWRRCPARGASTPGRENAGRVESMPRRGEIIIAPNPFGRRRDRETVITGALAEGETGFTVRLFSVDGMAIRRIAGENGGARFFSCRWDGRRDDGSEAPSGLYICCVEFIGAGGGVCRREKKCVAVSGEQGFPPSRR